MRKPGLTVVAMLLLPSFALAQAETPLPPPPPPPMVEAPPPQAFEPMPAAGPLRMEGVAGQTPPLGYHAQTEFRTGLVVAGAITFGVVWVVLNLFPLTVANAFGGCGNCNLLIIPAIGPIILATQSNSSLASLLVLDAIVQAGGLAMLITGLAAQRTVWVRDARRVQVLPILSPGMQGLGVVGSF